MASNDGRPMVAVLVYPGCTVAEVVETATRLRNNQHEVVWVTADAETVADQSGLVISVLTPIDALDPRTVDVLLVPGGDPGAIIGNPSVQAFVAAVASTGITAGICAGVVVLGDAGVLAGRDITHNYRAPWAPLEVEAQVADMFVGARVEPDRSTGVVVSDRVITALPNATAEFTVAVCRACGLYDDNASSMVRHLRGDFVPALFTTSTPAPAEITVRAATTSDIDDLVRLQIALFEEDAGVHEPFVDLTWPVREGVADFESLLGSSTSVVLIADRNEVTTGFLVGYSAASSPTRQPITYAVLRSLFVEPGSRNTGAGAGLVAEFFRWATALGAAEAHVSAYAANHGAHRFYERHGFTSHSILKTLPLPAVVDAQ